MSPSITEIIARQNAQQKMIDGILNDPFQLGHTETLEERVKKARAEFVKRVFKKHKIIEGLEEINRNYLSYIQNHEVRFFPEQAIAILIWGNKYSFDKDGEVEFNSDCSFIKVSFASSRPFEFRPETPLSILGREGHLIYSKALEEIRAMDRLREEEKERKRRMLIYDKEPERSADYFDPSYNCEQIKEALAECYLNPRRYTPQVDLYKASTISNTNWEDSNPSSKGKKKKSKPEPDYYIIDRPNSSECCCECHG